MTFAEFTRSLRRLLALAAVLATGASATSGAAEMDSAEARLSAAGLFQVRFESRLDPIQINRMHDWVVHLSTPDGAAVEDATITISGGMPSHNHGLPTAPRMTRYLGGGTYLIEGVRFQMAGEWTVTFVIAAGDRTDTVTFDLAL